MDIKERLKIDGNIMQYERASWCVIGQTEKLTVRYPGLSAARAILYVLDNVRIDSMGYLKILPSKNFSIDDIKLI